MANGRVMYLRWEYTDLPHSNSRILFHMNPDGTGQMEYYGSNSYWPNAVYFARAVPGDPSKVAAIVSGHHGDYRMGELFLFDPAKGRREDRGVIQRIPGSGKKIETRIKDRTAREERKVRGPRAPVKGVTNPCGAGSWTACGAFCGRSCGDRCAPGVPAGADTDPRHGYIWNQSVRQWIVDRGWFLVGTCIRYPFTLSGP